MGMGSCASVPNMDCGGRSTANCPVIVIQNDIFAINPAGQFRVRNFDLCLLISRDTSIGDSDSPKHGRGEIRWLRDGVHVG